MSLYVRKTTVGVVGRSLEGDSDERVTDPAYPTCSEKSDIIRKPKHCP